MGDVDIYWCLQRLVEHSGHEHQHLQRERNDTMNIWNVRLQTKHLKREHVDDIPINSVLEIKYLISKLHHLQKL